MVTGGDTARTTESIKRTKNDWILDAWVCA